MRCVHSRIFCTEERLGGMWKNCPIGQAFAAETAKLDEYVRQNFQSIVNPTGLTRYLWRGKYVDKPLVEGQVGRI